MIDMDGVVIYRETQTFPAQESRASSNGDGHSVFVSRDNPRFHGFGEDLAAAPSKTWAIWWIGVASHHTSALNTEDLRDRPASARYLCWGEGGLLTACPNERLPNDGTRSYVGSGWEMAVRTRRKWYRR